MATMQKDENTGDAEPEDVQELTKTIQNMIRQMQDKFQLMSDQLAINIRFLPLTLGNIGQAAGSSRQAVDKPKLCSYC
nr:unnamed protein product [Spirometra erinaceieuropaei]